LIRWKGQTSRILAVSQLEVPHLLDGTEHLRRDKISHQAENEPARSLTPGQAASSSRKCCGRRSRSALDHAGSKGHSPMAPCPPLRGWSRRVHCRLEWRPFSHFRRGYYAVIFGSPRYLTSGQQIGQFFVVSSCSLRCLAAQSKQKPWPQGNCRPYGCSFGEEMWAR
jgi:hypothetical protein